MSDPRALARSLRVRLAEDIDPAEQAILGAWVRAYRVIRDDLVESAEKAAAAGPLSPSDFRAARLGRSMNNASALLRLLARRSSRITIGAVPRVVAGSAEVNRAMLVEHAGGGIDFAQAKPSLLEAIVTRTSQQIASGFRRLTEDAEESLRVNLVRAVAAGDGPAEAARRMETEVTGLFGGGRARALNLARTELLDAHRAAAQVTREENSGLVTGWQWSSALTARTCPACWAMHGTIHPNDEVLEGHQSCRCVALPVLRTDRPEDLLLTGEAEFARLPRAQQLAIMGPGRLAALEDGLPFTDLAVRRENPGWRAGHYAAPIRDLGPAAALTPEPDPYDDLLTDEAQVEALLNDTLAERLAGSRLDALERYQQSYYRYLNEGLRSDADGDLLTRLSARNRNAADLYAMHEGLLSIAGDVKPVPRAVRVYRGSRSVPAGWDGQVGATFTDRGWSSTSSSSTTAETYSGRGGVVLEVEVPRGARVIPMDKGTVGAIDPYGEHEFIIPPGARYVVLAVEERRGVQHIRARLLP